MKRGSLSMSPLAGAIVVEKLNKAKRFSRLDERVALV
jgi:hypothetical protein